MPNLLAMSFEGELAPSFDLRCLAPGRRPPDGWGIGYYPGGEPCASVLKEPVPQQGSIRSDLVRAWDHLASQMFVVHIRRATWGSISDANTQPFSRPYAGREWLMGHSGSLNRKLDLGPRPRFAPVGSTDTERVFCKLLAELDAGGLDALADVPLVTLRLWFEELNDLGALTMVVSDGRDLLAYVDRTGDGDMYLWELTPPYDRATFVDADLAINLTERGISAKRGVIVSSDEMALDTDGSVKRRKLAPGDLLVIRGGGIRIDSQGELGQPRGVDPVASRRMRIPRRVEPKQLLVQHRTAYNYQRDVERSTHVLRLTPTNDRHRTLLSHQISVSVDHEAFDFEDVFGNQVRRLLIDTPYRELVVEARSLVEVRDAEPITAHPRRGRSAIPIVWMPWQRQILQPFLLPPELPETQLQELIEYAMGFVDRNDQDLYDTLFDINATIYKEYQYRQGSTTLATTAWDVYCTRCGVCQDFTNLFICLARLLSVPARYAFGYVYTGPKEPTAAYAEASHAWVEVYFPEVGWRGFDPTNGSVVQTDHVRVAVGRNFIDATPMSGTIYVGGGSERLSVDVSVELLPKE